MPVDIQVLIPTLASADRRQSILRAIDCALSQSGVRVTPHIVINGNRFDPKFRSELETRKDIKTFYLEQPNLFAARQFARQSVTAPFFSWLDDDDVYLPGAMAKRMELFERDQQVDAVVSNGYVRRDGTDHLLFENVADIERDPLGTLLKKNWLCAAGGLYRTSGIHETYFDLSVKSLDMTFLAFRMTLEKKLAFIGEPTFRKNVSPGSLSTTDAWMLPAVKTLERMSGYKLTATHKRMLRRKLSATRHVLSDYYLGKDMPGQAWSMHFSSLTLGGGWYRYLFYTRKLMAYQITRLTGLKPAQGQ